MNGRNDTTTSFERWLELLRSSCVRYDAQRNDEQPFVGWVQPFALSGIEGTDVGCNASESERTPISSVMTPSIFLSGSNWSALLT
jgi:hypothetical protein